MLGWGPTTFVVLFILSLRRLIMCASSRSSRSVGMRIEGRSAENSKSGRPNGGLGSPAVVVIEVFPVAYLPSPSKGKEKISKIRYPYGFEYLRASMKYANAVDVEGRRGGGLGHC